MLAHARLAIALEGATPNAIDVMVNAGDILIFKNYRVLHMRVAFGRMMLHEAVGCAASTPSPQLSDTTVQAGRGRSAF